jgi:OFA family oxalate/formate antiporter-like MFS transporter
MPVSRGRFKNIYYGWILVTVVFLISAVVWGIQYTFGIFFTQFQDTFGWSRATISLASTVQVLLYSLSMIPSIRAIDRYNEHIVFSLGALLYGVGFALCSYVTHLWQLYLFYGVITGVACGIFFPALNTIISRWFTEKRGLALGIALAGVGVGTFLFPPIVQYLISKFGWPNAFTILGIASFAVLIVCAQFIKRAPPGLNLNKPSVQSKQPEPIIENAAKPMTIRQVLKTREIYLILVGSTFVFFTVRAVLVHLVPHIQDVTSSAVIGALAISVIGISGTVGRVFMGIVQDRIGAKRSMMITITVLALAVLSLSFIKLEAGFFIFALAFGFAYGGDLVQTPVIVANCYGAQNVGLVYAMVMTIGNIVGCATGPYLMGLVYDLTGSYNIVFISIGIACLIGAYCVSRLKIRYR